MQITYQELLAQAQQASQSEDWALLSQCLHQLLLSEETPTAQGGLTDSQAATLLDLSLQVLEFGSFQERWEATKLIPALSIDADASQFPAAIAPQVPKGIAPLIEFLEDDDADPDVQWFAIRALSGFSHPSVITALIAVLKSSDNQELHSITITALAQLGKPIIPALAELIRDDSTRFVAVQTLGHIRHSETVPVLLEVVNDPDAQIRAIAVEALGSFHSPQIAKALVQALSDRSTPVRRAAVSALGFCTSDDLGNLDVVAYLRPLLRDLDVEVCCQCAIALSRLGTIAAIDALDEVLHSPHTPDRLLLEVIRSLGWLNRPEALQRLHQALTDLPSDEIRLEIVTTLGRIISADLKGEATQILLEAMTEDSDFASSAPNRQEIALSLGQLGDQRAIDPLIRLLADPDVGVRLHVISALKTLDPIGAHHALEELSKAEDLPAELAEGVAIALQEWNINSV